MTSPAVATRRGLVAAGDRVVLADERNRRRTGTGLAARIDQVAGALDLGDGARVGVWMQNAIETIEAYLAVEWIGATRVPIDPHAAPAEAANVIGAAGCDLVITDDERAHRLAELATPPRCDVVVHGEARPLVAAPRSPVEDVPEHRPLHLYPRGVVGEELLAVPITYAGWDWTVELNARLYRDGTYGPPSAAPTFVTAQQLMHGTALLGTFSFLRHGWPQVVMASFDAAAFIDVAERHAATSAMVVTGMLPPLADALQGRPPPVALTQIVYGGAPIPDDQLREVIAALPDRLVQVYGRLEGGWPITVLDQRDHAAITAGNHTLADSCGRPIGDVELELRPHPRSPHHELRVRSPAVSPPFADPDGWCGLGDLAWRDDGGHLHLAGRDDDMINTGYHVYPAEIQAVLDRVPGVAESRVFGVPDPTHGERVAARVTTCPSYDAESVRAAIVAELNRSLARYKHPRDLEILSPPT